MKSIFAVPVRTKEGFGLVPEFSERSKKVLSTIHPRLRELFTEVVKKYDCSALSGFRGEEEQGQYFRLGLSKLEWPKSKHNVYLSLAVDVAPYPLDWDDHRRFYHFAGYVTAVAASMNILVRWGGDWNGDFDFKDQNFHDLPHWEYIGEAQ